MALKIVTDAKRGTTAAHKKLMAFSYSIHSECHKKIYISFLWPATNKKCDMKKVEAKRISYTFVG